MGRELRRHDRHLGRGRRLSPSDQHHLRGVRSPGVAAVVLSAAAGYVDAYVYLRVAEVFIANQSGNLIVGGISLAGAEVGDIVLPFISVIAYITGAAVAAAAFDRPARQGLRRLRDTVIAVVVVLAVAALVLRLGDRGFAAGPRSPLVTFVVAMTALSMGAQATAVRRTGQVPVLTTASTGAITSLGVELGRHRGRLDPAARARSMRLIALVTSYVGGAVLGGLASEHTPIGPELLLVPCVALLVLLAWQHGTTRSTAPV